MKRDAVMALKEPIYTAFGINSSHQVNAEILILNCIDSLLRFKIHSIVFTNLQVQTVSLKF